MNQAETLKIAITYAQSLMAKELAIDTDGKWGRFTHSIYGRVSPRIKSAVDDVLRSAGTSADKLYADRVSEKSRAVISAAGAGDVRTAIEAAAREGGISVPLAMGFVKIESNFDPRAKNGSSRGLMQMQPAAWKDAQSVLPGLPPYDDGVFDPLQNARAGVAYIKLTARRVRALGFNEEYTPEVAYLAHQQGAGGFVELWRAFKGQPALTNYVSELAMKGNTPQDGKGPTTNKAEFYTRWLAAAKRKIGPIS